MFLNTILINPSYVRKLISIFPNRWGLNPKMRAMQTQPTVCPNLVFHIQRGQLKMHPNITRMEDKKIFFTDGSHIEVDSVVFCTGYSIDIPYLHKDIQTECLKEGNQLEVRKSSLVSCLLVHCSRPNKFLPASYQYVRSLDNGHVMRCLYPTWI